MLKLNIYSRSSYTEHLTNIILRFLEGFNLLDYEGKLLELIFEIFGTDNNKNSLKVRYKSSTAVLSS